MSVSLYGSGNTVIQVQSTTLTTPVTITGTTETAITGLSVTITPQSTTSKILIFVTVNMGQGTGLGRFSIQKNGSDIAGALGTASGSQTVCTFVTTTGSGAQQVTGGMQYLDSPATTSATTYSLAVSSNDSGQGIYINRSAADSNTTQYQKTISNITVMEIAYA